MKRSDHFNVVAGKCLNVYSLSVNGREYAISGVSPDNKLVLHCLDANDRVREEVAFEHWLSRGFMYNAESDTLCPISYELTDNSYVFYCSDEPVSFLANWKIGTYGFARNKFPFIVPFHKFNPDNIGKSLQYNVIKQQ